MARQSAPFVEWPMPPDDPGPQPGQRAELVPTCRMWLETTPVGIAVAFEPSDGTALVELRQELSTLASRLRDVESLAPPAPVEEEKPEGEVLAKTDAAAEPRAAPALPVAPAPAVVERFDAEQAAGSLETLETAAEAASLLGAGRAETQGLREIMALKPAVSVEETPRGVRLAFSTRHSARLEPLRANVRWHAADLMADAAVDGTRADCVRLPAVVAASATE